MDDSPFGPLTQRLVSALIEDNLMAPMDDAMQDMAGETNLMFSVIQI